VFGYSGHIPDSVQAGDILQVLNIGGVLGICDSVNPDKGKPFDARVLGCVLQFPFLGERIGVPARVGYKPLDSAAPLDTHRVPVVALAGTCMEAGKTAAACAIVSRMRHRGLAVHAFKATGVSLRRDILAMEDAGARRSQIFTDFGIVTTTARSGPALTRTMLTEMTQGRPDDPVAAWGGVKLLRERFGIEPCAVTGPATDNAVGVNIIEQQMNVRAFNAMTSGAALGDHIIDTLGITTAQPAAAANQ
jgi:hypothetical protein